MAEDKYMRMEIERTKKESADVVAEVVEMMMGECSYRPAKRLFAKDHNLKDEWRYFVQDLKKIVQEATLIQKQQQIRAEKAEELVESSINNLNAFNEANQDVLNLGTRLKAKKLESAKLETILLQLKEKKGRLYELICRTDE